MSVKIVKAARFLHVGWIKTVRRNHGMYNQIIERDERRNSLSKDVFYMYVCAWGGSSVIQNSCNCFTLIY